MKQLCACTWSSDVNKRAFPSTDILHTAFCTGVRNMSKDYLVFSSVEMPVHKLRFTRKDIDYTHAHGPHLCTDWGVKGSTCNTQLSTDEQNGVS